MGPKKPLKGGSVCVCCGATGIEVCSRGREGTRLQLDQASPVPRSTPIAWFTYLSVLPYLNCTGEDGSKVAQVWPSPGEAPSPQNGGVWTSQLSYECAVTEYTHSTGCRIP